MTRAEAERRLRELARALVETADALGRALRREPMAPERDAA